MVFELPIPPRRPLVTYSSRPKPSREQISSSFSDKCPSTKRPSKLSEALTRIHALESSNEEFRQKQILSHRCPICLDLAWPLCM
ncbi:hypothetical protein VKT23_019419 [Stygiomarasmius scandens]|uniref:Uncharacterized protein n=1 Tax=Marasmiellus scandens TaxID=2682957 RepID=A0ABR1ILG6_9AGAR